MRKVDQEIRVIFFSFLVFILFTKHLKIFLISRSRSIWCHHHLFCLQLSAHIRTKANHRCHFNLPPSAGHLPRPPSLISEPPSLISLVHDPFEISADTIGSRKGTKTHQSTTIFTRGSPTCQLCHRISNRCLEKQPS